MNTISLKGIEYTPKEFNKKFGLIGMSQLRNFMDQTLLKSFSDDDYWIDLFALTAYCNQKSIVVA